jgi:hypothetical protein
LTTRIALPDQSIQRISGSNRATGDGEAAGWPMMIGVTGRHSLRAPRAAFPAGVPKMTLGEADSTFRAFGEGGEHHILRSRHAVFGSCARPEMLGWPPSSAAGWASTRSLPPHIGAPSAH